MKKQTELHDQMLARHATCCCHSWRTEGDVGRCTDDAAIGPADPGDPRNKEGCVAPGQASETRWCAGTEQGGSSRPAERASRHMVEWIQQHGGQDDCAGQTGDVLSTNIQKVPNESHVGSRSTGRSDSQSMAASNSHVANIIPRVLVREMRSNILPNTLAEEADGIRRRIQWEPLQHWPHRLGEQRCPGPDVELDERELVLSCTAVNRSCAGPPNKHHHWGAHGWSLQLTARDSTKSSDSVPAHAATGSHAPKCFSLCDHDHEETTRTPPWRPPGDARTPPSTTVQIGTKWIGMGTRTSLSMRLIS